MTSGENILKTLLTIDYPALYNGAMKHIGIGIVTYNRPDYLQQCFSSIRKNLHNIVHKIYIYNDGSTADYKPVIKEILFEVDKNGLIFDNKKNKGVAHAKNVLLQQMIDDKIDYIFLIEDDILVQDSKAVTEYIRVCEEYGYHHLMFAHHGPANAGGPMYKDKDVEYYTQCVGAFCIYTRESLLKLKEYDTKKGFPNPGLMDENFHNAWEHVEHTLRLGNIGLTAPFGLFADVVYSADYLKEIPGSIANSSIRTVKKVWMDNQLAGIKYWESKHKEKAPIDMVVEKVEQPQ